MRSIHRRAFVQTAAAAVAATAVPRLSSADEQQKAEEPKAGAPGKWKKAFMLGGVNKGPILPSFQLLKDAGFEGVEIQFPYDEDPLALRRAAGDLPIVLINVPAADGRGGVGRSTDAGQQGAFLRGVEEAVRFAEILRVEKVNVLPGPPPAGQLPGVTDDVLAQSGLTRRVVLSVPHFLFVMSVLASTDLVAMLPSRLVRNVPALQVVEPPAEVPGYEMAMLWHDRLHRDPAHRWLREFVGGGV